MHRDIKPANVLFHNGMARVKITDFGLARAVDDASLTQSGIIAGTPQYMSPEQARGDAINASTDLFSLGSVLYAMCTGRPPFRAAPPWASSSTPYPKTVPEPCRGQCGGAALARRHHRQAARQKSGTAFSIGRGSGGVVLGRHLAEVLSEPRPCFTLRSCRNPTSLPLAHPILPQPETAVGDRLSTP